jgi:hypothetical protein
MVPEKSYWIFQWTVRFAHAQGWRGLLTTLLLIRSRSGLRDEPKAFGH